MTLARVWPFLVLLAMGAGWGMTIPLTKIAVSTGYQHFGLIFWQLAICSVLLGVVQTLRGRWPKVTPANLRLFLIIALVGTILPNSASYTAAIYLPGGVLSILISTVPMFAFPIALMMGNDRFQLRRLGGLVLGFIGVLILIGPEARLSESATIGFILLGLVAPLFYGFEGNYVAKYGTQGLDPVETLFGACILGVILIFPTTLASGQWIDLRQPWSAPDYALFVSSLLHVFVYTTYVWLVGRVGSVFASQVSYAVTLFAVFWSIILLGERPGLWFWGALLIMLLGMFLVAPRRQTASID